MAVEIQLTNRYWLVSDTYSWALGQERFWRNSKTGERERRIEMEAWYGTIGDVLQGCYERELRLSDAKTLEDLARDAFETATRLRQATIGLDKLPQLGGNEESMT